MPPFARALAVSALSGALVACGDAGGGLAPITLGSASAAAPPASQQPGRPPPLAPNLRCAPCTP